ncbi:endospore germination permease [Clostridiaceae bacterium UIB06]|uniref:Endospore germination permease n=1 Tax=Clostridium thailandense TaxID=2794346 RepID=A0A949TXK0_9CLOT|nr:endospore germination permease [Clostridium thailandense]MBV7272324.1 endospore germination permease [Clostridium thailandense]MCH5136713.1 endospore germination permease [Clostridiaceae bacterium UIB06]
MENNRNSINSTQARLFMLTAEIGVGILSLPADLAKSVGHDGWICVIAACFISIVAGILIAFFLKRYSDRSILEINKLLYGKYIGTFINYVLVVYTFLISSYILRRFSELIKISILRNTPSVILSFFVTIPTIYLTWYGLKAICRYCKLFYASMATMLLLLVLVSKNIRITFLQPVGEAGLMTIIKGVGTVSFSFLGYELLSFIYPNIEDKNKVVKSTIIATFLSGIFYVLIVIVCTGVFGENRMKFMTFPTFSLSRIYKSEVIERVDLFFISFWMPITTGAMRNYYFCTYDSCYRLLNIKKPKVLHTLVLITTVVVSRIPKNVIQVEKLGKLVNIYGISVIGFLLISYALSFANKRGVVDNEGSN